MPARLASALAGAALVVAGCGAGDPSLAQACRDATPASVRRALRAAPKDVALPPDGTRISACVANGVSNGDIQAVGTTLTTVATELAPRTRGSRRAAVELGFLVGAAQRGARGNAGIHLELLRRLEQSIGIAGLPGDRAAAYQRGERAGREHG